MDNIKENLKLVLDRIEKARESAAKEKISTNSNVRLVAVSKTKSIAHIIEAYEAGQRHFGENYVQELEEKANSDEILKKCPEIKWHFIGHLQSNKAKKVATIPNLYCIETVDSLKLADTLNNIAKANNKIINVMIQVNTSREEQKNGIMPELVNETFLKIKEICSNLNLIGLMTIGSYEQSTNQNEINKDFKVLNESKNELIEKLKIDGSTFEISMGMSHDFEQAIRMGSNNVRVGSLLFGSR